jgi:hypothetical protein
MAAYTTKSFHMMKAPENRWLIRMGDPEEVVFCSEGRRATRTEVEESVRKGLPFLRKLAEEDGPEAVAALETLITEKSKLWAHLT